LALLAVGELVADKLPFTPARTRALSVAFRVLSGAAVGAAIFTAQRKHPAPGILLGTVGALAATYGMYEARRQIDARLHAPDPLVGAVEDLIAVGSAFGATAGMTVR